MGNGYSPKLLNRLLWVVPLSRVTKNKNVNKGKVGSKGFLILPNIDENLLHKVKHVVNRMGLNIRLAWRSEYKLRNGLVRSASTQPRCPGRTRCTICKSGFGGQCTQKNGVYSLRCKACIANGDITEYVGDTKRHLRLRFNEHFRDICNRKDTPMGDHFTACHPDFGLTPSPIEARILYRAKDHPDRKIAESILIRNRKPVLNSNVASWPIM